MKTNINNLIRQAMALKTTPTLFEDVDKLVLSILDYSEDSAVLGVDTGKTTNEMSSLSNVTNHMNNIEDKIDGVSSSIFEVIDFIETNEDGINHIDSKNFLMYSDILELVGLKIDKNSTDSGWYTHATEDTLSFIPTEELVFDMSKFDMSNYDPKTIYCKLNTVLNKYGARAKPVYYHSKFSVTWVPDIITRIPINTFINEEIFIIASTSQVGSNSHEVRVLITNPKEYYDRVMTPSIRPVIEFNVYM